MNSRACSSAYKALRPITSTPLERSRASRTTVQYASRRCWGVHSSEGSNVSRPRQKARSMSSVVP